MKGRLLCPGLLNTGVIDDGLCVVLDGLVNFYVVKAPTGLVCIDTGWRTTRVRHGFETLGLNMRDVVAVFVTHLHWDHARCMRMFPDADIFIGEQETPALFMKGRMPEQPWEKVRDGQTTRVGGVSVRVVDTPGHTRGSVSYVIAERWLFTGDALRLRHGKALPFPIWFNQDARAMDQSIRKLARIKGIECLMTAHNGIGREVEKAFDQWLDPVEDLSRRGRGA